MSNRKQCNGRVPAILSDPLDLSSRQPLEQQLGSRMRALCEHYGVPLDSVTVEVLPLIIALARKVHPRAFRVAVEQEQCPQGRPWTWGPSQEKRLMKLIDELRSAGLSVVEAIEKARKDNKDYGYASAKTLENRYYRCRARTLRLYGSYQSEMPENSIPLKPDGSVDFGLAARHLLWIYESMQRGTKR